MRSEKEMYSLILGFAEKEDNIRAVILNGSRTNPNVKKDKYQDFDIVYLCREPEKYIKDKTWFDIFGERLVWQLPDENPFYEPSESNYGILLQFSDGNRIDFSIADIKSYYGYCFDDRLSVVLLDKDGVLPELPAPDESSHYIKKPDQVKFSASRCEFWWVSMYVGKGLKRHQLLYAEECFSNCVRKELKKMLNWYAQIIHGENISSGKSSYRLNTLLPENTWERFASTFFTLEEECIWEALFTACELYTEVSRKVADFYGFKFLDMINKSDNWDENVYKYLRKMKDEE